MEYSVVLFHSNNYAMWAADLLNDSNIENKLISVPRQFSSDCGYCVRIETSRADKVNELLNKENIEFDRIEKI